MNKKEEIFDIFEFSKDCIEKGDYAWSIVNEDEIDEGKKSLVDGQHVIARARGPFFLVNASSNNDRFYPRGLWEKQLSERGEVIESGRMIGAVGHKQPLDDKAVSEGLISHRVNKLWIDENSKIKGKSDARIGMGEVLIYGTPSGKNLNTIMRGGTPVFVSSRGYGSCSGEKTGGSPSTVDAETYYLETFDFVMNPGVTIAKPVIVEEDQTIKSKINNETIMEDRSMDNNKIVDASILESITKEKIKTQDELDKVLGENEKLKAKMELSDSKVIGIESKLEAYEKLGSVEDIIKLTSKVDGFFEDVDNLKSELEEKDLLINQYEEWGSVEDIKSLASKTEGLFEKVKKFEEEFGDLNSLRKTLDVANEVMNSIGELGTIDDVITSCEFAEEFQEKFGSIEDVDRAIDMAKAFIDKVKEESLSSKAESIAEEFGVPVDKVRSLVDSSSVEEARELLKSLVSNTDLDITGRYKSDNINENSENNDEHFESVVDKPFSSRLMTNTAL